ncbi:MAG: PEP-CTERM sorting domain-containing protein [Akkermansiaceae bacterium]|nr:PEP-CTERM sorting domain-containing protein [Akkermansiaceae bacterium]
MKLHKILPCLVALTSPLTAATIIVSDTVTSTIPDGSSSGLARQLVVNAPGESVVSIEVDLLISAASGESAFLGDLYVYLSHGSDLVVLLNRAGKTATAPFGYSDNQSVNVTFTDTAARDIHNYRIPVTGSNGTPLSSSLTGNWQPDDRAVDPAVVLDTSSRGTGFGAFTGDAAGGNWNLFAADLSTGAQHQITGWTLRITTIPEPSSALLFVTAAAFALRRKRA